MYAFPFVRHLYVGELTTISHIRTLVKAGVIRKPENGYIIDDFLNKDICKLVTDKSKASPEGHSEPDETEL